MNTWHFLAMNAAQRLAINRNGFVCLQTLGSKPLTQDMLKGRVVELPKHPMHGRSAHDHAPA